MTAPTVHEVTQRWYDALPEIYRVADPDLGWPLLRYLSLIGDQLGEGVDILDQVDYVGPLEGGPVGATSALIDPSFADGSWLPWLAQLVGVQLTGGETVPVLRTMLGSAASGWQGGTVGSIAAAAQSVLTGSKYVTVADHGGGGGSVFSIEVRTRAVETPGGADSVLAAVNAAGVVPAGIVLTHRFYAASWDVLEAAYPTSTAWDATGSWDVIESTQGATGTSSGFGATPFGSGGFGS